MRRKTIRIMKLGDMVVEWEDPEPKHKPKQKPKQKLAAKSEDYRTAYCKGCGEPLDSRFDEICPKCGWIICPSCGDCGCS